MEVERFGCVLQTPAASVLMVGVIPAAPLRPLAKQTTYHQAVRHGLNSVVSGNLRDLSYRL